MKKLVLASNNKNKLIELREILSDLRVEVVSQSEAGCDFEVDENGDTFEENAYLKAIAVTEATGLPAIADDSGLVVDALDGAPGVHSARYGGLHGQSDEYRYRLLLKSMEGKENRKARFVSCICCTMPDGQVLRTRGECEGSILYSPKGKYGFGYDPIFQVEGSGKSMAELTPEEKNAVSHRGRALEKFKILLKEKGGPYAAYK